MVTIKEIEQLAKLAKLKFSDERKEELTKEMDEIIEFANQINSSNYDLQQETADVVVGLGDLRKDVVIESLPNETIVSNVESIDGFFPVKKSNVKK